MAMKLFYFISFAVFISLQYSLFFSHNSLISYFYLKNKLEKNQNELLIINKKNKDLQSVISNIKNNKKSLEIYAREKLGLIKTNEIFFQIIKDDAQNN